MQKKYILIIGAVVIILVVGGLFFIFSGKNTTTDPVLPTATPTPDPIFTATPTPDMPLISDICSSQWANQTDTDQDGLPDNAETIYKTDSSNSDTDGDTFKDGEEVRNGYDPLKPGSARLDSDNDELTDDQECKWNTDAFNPDTDGDSFKDGVEIKNGYDPLIPGSARLNPVTPAPTEPAFSPTPTPLGFSPRPSAIPNTPAPTGIIVPGITMVGRNELIISKNNSAASVKTYLANVDKIKPISLTTGTQFSEAVLAAFNGNAAKLRPILATLKQHEQKILAISTPEVAINHQILLASLVRLVNQQLTIIADTAGKDNAKQYNAALELQRKLSSNVNSLKTERDKLNLIAN